ncbi:MAG: CCA tRNA nucleotidyltransferase [Caulobacteraceae bacterium]
MSETLPPQPWMTTPEVEAVFSALEREGGQDAARFVGGCVRDALVGKAVSDIDIATPLVPERVMAALQAAGLGAHPTGIDHGTITATAKGKPFEITTLRRDVETDGRRAVVAFTTDWAEDAQRRDFRLNGLYLDRAGRIYDPTGGGVADAKAGRIIFVGDPEMRLREDHLRNLRFFRFHAWYGRGEPDAAALAACAKLNDGVVTLSGERLAKELLKLLAAPDPRPSVRLMEQAGVLGKALPQAHDIARFEALAGFETDPELRLAALLSDDALTVAAAAKRLRLSNVLRRRLLCAVPNEVTVGGDMSEPELRRAIYLLGAGTVRDRLQLARASGSSSDAPWADLMKLTEVWQGPSFPLGGDDVKAAGVPEGPRLGRFLAVVENWWLENDFAPDREALLARLKRAVEAQEA